MARFLLCLSLLLLSNVLNAQDSAKFLPPDGKTLLIIGQDLSAIGGMPNYTEGYADAVVRTPAGLTTYIGLPNLSGLTTLANWGSGDVSAQMLVDTPRFANSVLSIGLNIGSDLNGLAIGKHDEAIESLVQWMKAQQRPIFLRIGYEFDAPWNAYDPSDYIAAFRRIVDHMRREEVVNVATVWQSATWVDGTFNNHVWEEWYPGNEYVDWFGLSYFDAHIPTLERFLELANTHGKPVMIAESTPRTFDLAEGDTEAIWEAWFVPFFEFIAQHNDQIRAVAYINVNWDEQAMWKGQEWGDSRIQANSAVRAKWVKQVTMQSWLHASPTLFEQLGFTPVVVETPVVSFDERGEGAFTTGIYPNALAEYGLSQNEIDARIAATFEQLFYGDDNQRVYYEVGDDMAYLLDVNNADIRSEGMSYGMMITVQLDKQAEFDRIWKWAYTYMLHQDGPYKGYFSWHNREDGSVIDDNTASDGEIWIAMALLFASKRWGDGVAPFDYSTQAQAILQTMLHKDDENNGIAESTFDAETKLVKFVAMFGTVGDFTDPSYHMPHFFELWSHYALEDNAAWLDIAQRSRQFLTTTVHPVTGLMPNYATFAGAPQPDGDYGEFYFADAWRTASNIAMDGVWFGMSDWHVQQSRKMLAFFYERGIGQYTNRFRIDGTPVDPQGRSAGHIAMNAVATLASDAPTDGEFIAEFLDTPLPTGQYRYYDGLLYMLGLLQLSGNFRMY